MEYKDLNLREIWDLLINKYPEYENIYSLEGFNDKGYLILPRVRPGICHVCGRKRDNYSAFILIEGEEQNVLLSCFKTPKRKIFIACLKPELKEVIPYVPFQEPRLEDHERITTKAKIKELSEENEMVFADVGMGKAQQLVNFQKNYKRVLILSPRIAFTDYFITRLAKEGSTFTHYLGGPEALHKEDKLVLQMDSLWRIGDTCWKDCNMASYDLLILYDLACLNGQWEGRPMDEYRIANYTTFLHLLKSTSLIKCFDSFPHQYDIDFIKSIRPDFKLKVYKDPNPRIREYTKLVSNGKTAMVGKLLSLIRKGKKVYVTSYSKNILKALEVPLKEENVNYAIYHADIDDRLKREHLSNTNKYWPNYQVVLCSSKIGPGVNFHRDHFDISFAIVDSSLMEEQVRVLQCVRELKDNKVYVWLRKETKNRGCVPTLEEIEDELNLKLARGKDNPELVSLPQPLRKLYVHRLQRKYLSKKRQGDEFKRLTNISYFDEEKLPSYDEEVSNTEENKNTVEQLWRLWYKSKSMRKIIKYAFLEKQPNALQSAQFNDSKVSFAEYSKELKPRLEVIKRLNSTLGLKSSHHGIEEISREEFLAKVNPIIEDKKVRELYKLPKENSITSVNKIYKDWTGQAKVFSLEKPGQVSKRETLLTIKEVSLGDKENPLFLWSYVRT